MKKLSVLLTSVLLLTVFSSKAAENNYVVDDQQIETLFNNSTDISTDIQQMNANAELFNNRTTQATNAAFYQQKSMGSDKNAAVAILLDFFLGELGIHRAYLGTKTFTWVGYILTCGGIGGIVPLVDFFVLIFDSKNLDKYVDNSKFFMW